MYRSLRYTTALISSHQTHSEEPFKVSYFSFTKSKTAHVPNVGYGLHDGDEDPDEYSCRGDSCIVIGQTQVIDCLASL